MISASSYPAPAIGAPALDGDRYHLTARLGEGGTAAVYRAWDSRIGIWRAVKILVPEFARRRKLRTRFEREAHTMARLEHKNLVRVYDVGTQQKVPYIVMELVTGGCLVDWVEAHGAMPPRLAVKAVLELCEGLLHAHASSIIHRDIKPHNALIDESGVCKLGDFGIAQIIDGDLTKTGSVMGTMGYMSPEQRRDAKSVDQRSDLYGLAATLWYLLKNGQVMDLFLAEEDVTMLTGIPKVLHPILQQALAYDRDSRQSNVAEFRDQLRDALTTLPHDPAHPPLPMPPKPAEVEASWFEELAPMFDQNWLATPNPVDQAMGPPHGAEQAPTPSVPTETSETPDLPTSAEPTPSLAPTASASLPPADLLEEVDDPDAPNLLVAIGVLVAVLLTIGLVGGLIWSTMSSASAEIEVAAEQHKDHRDQLHLALDKAKPVVYDLAALGASQRQLDQYYFDYLDVKVEPARSKAARKLIDQLLASGDKVVDSASASQKHAEARQRLEALRAAKRNFEASEANLADARGSVPGMLLELSGGTPGP